MCGERFGDDDRDDHQDDGAQALGPGRAAEEQPPDEDQQRADERRQASPGRGTSTPKTRLGSSDRDDKPDQHQQHRGGDAGPQPKRFASDVWCRS